MFWLFSAVHAHGHAHGHTHGHESDLFVAKEALVDRTRQIVELFTFISDHLDELPDPLPLSSLPNPSLLTDIAASHAPENTKFAFLERFFTFGPQANAVTAALHVMFATHILLRLCPPLGGSALDYLVAFAEGCILANVFMHLVPEALEVGPGGILAGFFFFCALEKTLKIIGRLTGNEHTHSHSVVEPVKTEPSSEKSAEKHSHSHENHAHSHESEAASSTPLYAVLNVAADFTHNITDGVGLAAAFAHSTRSGCLVFVLMVLHELPHQFGDFAVLLAGGASKSSALNAQLVASSGTVLGCLLYSSVREIEWLEQSITPFTAGVFLYIGTAGLLPELLEVGPAPLKQAAVQVAGVLSGVVVMWLTLS